MSDYHVKKIILPSGKAVQIVYFHPDDAVAAEPVAEIAAAAAPDTTTGLERCPVCECDLVHPVDWREAEGERWDIELQCPSCQWTHRGEFPQDVVERYDEALNEGTDALVDALERVSRENMEADIERFIDALHAGHIEPIDF
jgi:Zn-finger protein